jgi:all-trans-8'-apo-beta-carotenal 15,15'-oxygenase
MPTPIRDPRTKSWNTSLVVRPGDIDLTISTEKIQGKIPLGLRGGRVLSNGPGWTVYDNLTAHPFDGHGYLRTYNFNTDGSLSIKARFIQTEVYKEEAKGKNFIHRGFATNPSEHFWKNIRHTIPRNVSNTTVYHWAGRLITGWESGAPYAIDSKTLETLGEEDFGGLITGKITLAHMHQDPKNKSLIVVNMKRGRNTDLHIHEIDEQGKHIHSQEGQIPGIAFVHDFTFSDSWYIFGSNYLSVKPLEMVKSLLGAGTFLTSIETNTEKPGELILIPRNNQAEHRRIKLPEPVYVIHFVNSFEQEDGSLIVDASVFNDFTFGNEFGYSGKEKPFSLKHLEDRGAQSLYRITIPANSDSAEWKKLAPHGVDFPRVHPDFNGQNAPYMIGGTRADTRYSDPFDSLFFLDLQTPEATPKLWTTEPHIFVGEPLVLPDRITGIDYVASILTNGLERTSTLAIFDITDIEKGPICQVPMPLMPIAFHGDWDPDHTSS